MSNNQKSVNMRSTIDIHVSGEHLPCLIINRYLPLLLIHAEPFRTRTGGEALLTLLVEREGPVDNGREKNGELHQQVCVHDGKVGGESGEAWASTIMVPEYKGPRVGTNSLMLRFHLIDRI